MVHRLSEANDNISERVGDVTFVPWFTVVPFHTGGCQYVWLMTTQSNTAVGCNYVLGSVRAKPECPLGTLLLGT